MPRQTDRNTSNGLGGDVSDMSRMTAVNTALLNKLVETLDSEDHTTFLRLTVASLSGSNFRLEPACSAWPRKPQAGQTT